MTRVPEGETHRKAAWANIEADLADLQIILTRLRAEGSPPLAKHLDRLDSIRERIRERLEIEEADRKSPGS